jgi:hypothetical protein
VRFPRSLKVAIVLAAVVVLAACQPEGHIDRATTGDGVVRLEGWARDPDSTQPIRVHVYADGRFVGETMAVGARPDVQSSKAGTDKPAGPDHGFDITLAVPDGTRQVCVYGIDQAGGDANALIGCTGLVRCVVALHGLGGDGRATQVGIDGVKYVYPSGNAATGNGRRWAYATDAEYAGARAVVQRAIDENGCGQVVVDGFSNGGGFAGRMYCLGETFGGAAVGYVLDDPVTDHGATGCRRATGDHIAMYWTGALDYARAGFDCRSGGWVCLGGQLVGRDAYAAHLGTTTRASIHTSHQPYQWPEEIGRWL